MSDELMRPPPAPASPSPATKAIRERTYRDWFGDRWDDVKALGGALMLSIRFVVWVFDLDDGSGSADWRKASPSATKIAGLLMVFAGLEIIKHRCALATAATECGTDAAVNTLMIAGVSALFGRAIWKGFINRNLFTSTESAEAKVAYERREENKNVKIDAHYIVDGSGANVPAVSLPPDPAARTPSGDD